MDSVHFSVGDFLEIDRSTFIGRLTALISKLNFDIANKQVSAWAGEFEVMRGAAKYLVQNKRECTNWHFIFEYGIPRRGKRPDVIILADDVIFVLEFKVGTEDRDALAEWQVLDYALDLRDFHEESAGHKIVPILVPTGLDILPHLPSECSNDAVEHVRVCSGTELGNLVLSIYEQLHVAESASISAEKWCASRYRPVLSMIEAAEELFSSHSVREIAHAASDNLTVTTDRLIAAICDAESRRKRVICFVTGVPGSGKTLTGLNAVHDPKIRASGRPAGVFLSGNKPLVDVVREALARNNAKSGQRAKDARREVSTFVQNVHGFLQDCSADGRVPAENVIVFDEAQRAWNEDQMHKKRGIKKAEAEILLEIMERCEWCVIIALVGGGQEIHDGEGGLQEWQEALSKRAVDWEVVISPTLFEPAGASLSRNRFVQDALANECITVVPEPALHLSVSLRNVRSRTVSDWVDAVVECDELAAKKLAGTSAWTGVYLTRSLERAKRWLKDRAHGDRRYGLLCSSGALRHRAYGLELSGEFRAAYKYEEWFLAEPNDVRSSYQLEVAATEFECQGLEIDWSCVCWGDDFTFDPQAKTWLMRAFRGRKWQNINNEMKRSNLLNKYRVLLTRAREGMIIWVPKGSIEDPTRNPLLLDHTAEFLLSCGAVPLEERPVVLLPPVLGVVNSTS